MSKPLRIIAAILAVAAAVFAGLTLLAGCASGTGGGNGLMQQNTIYSVTPMYASPIEGGSSTFKIRSSQGTSLLTVQGTGLSGTKSGGSRGK